MKITLDTPDTLIFGVFVAEDRCTVTASLLDRYYAAVGDIWTGGGAVWSTLTAALAVAGTVAARHLLVLSTDAALVRALSPPFKAPPGAEATVQVPPVWAGRKAMATAYTVTWRQPAAEQWHVLMTLGGQWGGRFRAMQVDDLPRAKELWQLQQ